MAIHLFNQNVGNKTAKKTYLTTSSRPQSLPNITTTVPPPVAHHQHDRNHTTPLRILGNKQHQKRQLPTTITSLTTSPPSRQPHRQLITTTSTHHGTSPPPPSKSRLEGVDFSLFPRLFGPLQLRLLGGHRLLHLVLSGKPRSRE